MTSTVRHQSRYTDLARTVRDSGLMERRQGWYWTQILVMTGLFVATWVVVVLLGDTWWQLVPAAVLGAVVTQFGFLGHEAAHQQMFASPAWNEWAARILAAVFAGLAYAWWREKHQRHHANPNKEGRDPDIGPGLVSFTPAIAETRTDGALGWFRRRQGWLFFPLLTLEGVHLHYASVRTLLRPGPGRHRRLELLLVLTRLVGYVAALVLLLPLGIAAAFLAVQLAVFGFWLGCSFAPSHKGMPIVPPATTLDFLLRQVLTSRNVRGGRVLDQAMGGLNRQIEHHLFPSMPRPHLRLARPLVRAHCAEHGVPYTETGLLESYGIVVDYLNHVGLRARGPFECPLAAQLRD